MITRDVLEDKAESVKQFNRFKFFVKRILFAISSLCGFFKGIFNIF